MAIAVSREKTRDTSVGRCQPESGRVSLQSARREESNGIGFKESAWLQMSAGSKRYMFTRLGKGLIGIG